MTKKKALTDAEKRDRKTQQILLGIHIGLSALVLLATQLDWWSIHNSSGELVAVMSGSDPKVFQAGYLKVALLFAFVFTSYDLVADEDIQWPPLLASAFALGCCGQATYTVK